MEEGEDYVDSFAPVPHTTIGRLMMLIAAAENLHLLTIDLTQAFIQADKLDEGVKVACLSHPHQVARSMRKE